MVSESLKDLAEAEKSGFFSNKKSLRGGPAEVLVINRVKYQHEHVTKYVM